MRNNGLMSVLSPPQLLRIPKNVGRIVAKMSPCRSILLSTLFLGPPVLSVNTIAAAAPIEAPIGRLDFPGSETRPGCENMDIFQAMPNTTIGEASTICSFGDFGANVAVTGSVDAGLNEFSNVMSPILLNGTMPGVTNSVTLRLTSHPTWSPGVTMVQAHLQLTGQVTKSGNLPASITIDGIGQLGGPPLTIHGVFTDSGPVNLVDNELRSIGDAISTLTIRAEGAITFNALDSSELVGAAPEPSTIFLLGVGLAGLCGAVYRRRKAQQ